MKFKTRLFSLLLAVMFILTTAACSTPSANLVPNGDDIVATVSGVEITKQQVYAELVMFLSSYNMTLADIQSDAALLDRLKTDFVNDMVLDYLITANAAEMGYDYTAEEEALFEEEYGAFLTSLDDINREEAVANGLYTEQTVEEHLPELRESYFEATGYTAEQHKERQRNYFISARTQELVLADITVTEQDVRDYYDELLAAGQQTLTLIEADSPTTSYINLYYPEGYKYVKALHLEFDPTVRIANMELYTAGETEKLDAAIEREVAILADDIAQVQAEIAAGADFDALIEQYGDDDVMLTEPYKTTGYFEPNNNQNQMESYRNAIDSITEVGEIVECATYLGYWFLQSVEMVEEGPAPFDVVQTSLESNLITTRQIEVWDELSFDLLEKAESSGSLKVIIDNLDI